MKSTAAVAGAIKRFPACWLQFGGGRNVLIKKRDGKYLVQEADYATSKNNKITLKLTGRLFELPDGSENNPILQGWISSQTAKEPEEAIASVIGAWGCWPEKFIAVVDATAGSFIMDK